MFWSPFLILTQPGSTFPLGSESLCELCELSTLLQSLLNYLLLLFSESFYFFFSLFWVLLREIVLVWRSKSSQISPCWWSCTSPVQLGVAIADSVCLKSRSILLEETCVVALLASGIHNLNTTRDLIKLKNNFVWGVQGLKLKIPPVRTYNIRTDQVCMDFSKAG